MFGWSSVNEARYRVPGRTPGSTQNQTEPETPMRDVEPVGTRGIDTIELIDASP